jgi:hypothetical protein
MIVQILDETWGKAKVTDGNVVVWVSTKEFEITRIEDVEIPDHIFNDAVEEMKIKDQKNFQLRKENMLAHYAKDTGKHSYETEEMYLDRLIKKEQQFLKLNCIDEDFLKFAESYNNEKISSICKTIRDIKNSRSNRTVTHKQMHAISMFLLEMNNNSVKTILENIYN